MNRRTVAISGLVVSVLLAFISFKWYERFPWIDVAVYLHSQKGSINCGHVVEPDYEGAQQAIDCALSAQRRSRPFVVIFTVYGVDEQVSNAVMGNSNGNLTELFYAIGTVAHPNRLMTHTCSVPAQLQVDEKYYHIPRLHCVPWPPMDFVPAHLFW